MVGKEPHLNQRAGRCAFWLWGLFVVGCTLAAYFPAMRGGFVWDDDCWTSRLDSVLRNSTGLWRMWADPTTLQQYYPLTGTTFWIDHQLWGSWTLPYHLENVLLHVCSAMMFWRLLRRLEVPAAWLAAAIFALHPVMVESVAWITERKNVLSLMLFLMALLAYGRFASFWKEISRQDAGARKWLFYALALASFVGALLAKVTAHALPAVVLVLCWWKRGRVRWKEDVVPSLPFFLISVAFGLGVAWMEKHHVGAEGPDWDHSWAERALMAGRAFWFYAGKLLWPVNQCAFYPSWRLDAGSSMQWLYPVSAAAALAGVWFGREWTGRGFVAAVFCFAGTLFPVLGAMNVYGMRYAPVADHWVYLPSLALIALATGLVAHAAGCVRKPLLLVGLAVVVLPLLASLTWKQAGHYIDMETFCRTALARNPACWPPHLVLGNLAIAQGRMDEAVEHYEKSFKIRPDSAEAHSNMGTVLQLKGRLDEAAAHYEAALKIEPELDVVHENYASLLTQMGRGGEALTHIYHKEISRAGQNQWGPLVALAWTLATNSDASLRNGRLAVELALQADKRSNSSNPEVLKVLAAAYAEAGRFGEAVETTQRGLSLSKDSQLNESLRSQQAFYRTNMPFRAAVKPVESSPATKP